ncbi:MAG: Ig-like domain-containing protein, partial [Planctomycetota bacterium]
EHGELTAFDPETGDYTYKPDEGYAGTDSFTYVATDGDLVSEPMTVTITITNALPVALSDTAVTDAGAAVIINVLANDMDPDTDPITIDGFAYEGGGTLVLNADGTFTYTPVEGFAGAESFTYAISDPQIGAEPSEATVTITVNPVEVMPTVPPAPGLERIELEYSGCPALTGWAADELKIDLRVMQIWMVNALASTKEIQPCDACASLKQAAMVLQDADGIRTTALVQVVNEFASGTAPLSEEQEASIAGAIENDVTGDSRYAAAGEYIDALVQYVGVLSNELGFSNEQALAFASDNYVLGLAASQNANAAAYVSARLAELGGI